MELTIRPEQGVKKCAQPYEENLKRLGIFPTKPAICQPGIAGVECGSGE